jgi:hypothetical protein
MFNNLFISMNSVRLVKHESNQRRSPEQKHFGVNLLVRRLVGRSAGPLGNAEYITLINTNKMNRVVKGICGLLIVAFEAMLIASFVSGSFWKHEDWALIAKGLPMPVIIIFLMLMLLTLGLGIQLLFSSITGRNVTFYQYFH